MSKKTKQAARSKPQSAQRRESTPARSAQARGRSGHGRAAHVNLPAVKIFAAVLGVLCLAGAVAIFFLQQAPYATNVIIEVVLLAFIAGLCLFAVLRTESFVGFFKKL